MKKYTAILLASVMTVNGAAVFADGGAISLVSTDPDTQYITVSGTTESGGRERVTLRITRKGEAPDKDTILCAYQVNADENGAYSFGFTMPDNTAAAEYDTYVKAEDEEELRQSFRYFGDVSSALEENVNKASNASSLRAFFEADGGSGMEMFGIDAGGYSGLSESGKDFVISAVLSAKNSVNGFDSGKQLRDVFDQAVLIEQVRENKAAITDDNIAALTVDYTVDAGNGYGSYATMRSSAIKVGEDAETKAISAVKSASVTNVKSFWETYNDSVTSTIISNTEYWTEVRDFINDNRELIGQYADINWTRYNSNAQAVCRQLVRGNYATLSAFAAALKSAVSQTENSTEYSTGSGGSGGGSAAYSGSDGIRTTSVILPAPETSAASVNTGVSSESPASDPYKFDDMRRTPWANDAVSYLVDRKIISGYGDGTFRPENNITRQEFVTLAIKAFYPNAEQMDCDFEDVAKTSWAYPYIAAASNFGIVEGIGDNLFAPEDNIKRQDMALIINKILTNIGYALDKAEAAPFSDEGNISPYALEAVRSLRAYGIVNGDDENNFNPLAETTRAEAAVILYNVLSK